MSYNYLQIATLCICLASAKIFANEYKGFDDTVLFKIDWPGDDKSILV